MKPIILTLIIFVMATFAVNASKLPEQQGTDSLNFAKRINVIHSKVIDLTNIFALHHIKEFNEIYIAPLKFESSVIHYIQKPVSFENKIIAVCAMTKLPSDRYYDILNSYFILYTKSKIDENLLNRCVFNEFDTDNRLTKEYKNPEVRKLLSKMINCKTLSKQFRVDLKQTLNGKRYNDLKRTGHV